MSAQFEVDVTPVPVVFLAGIGQDASSWDPVIAGLNSRFRGLSYSITDLVSLDEPFTMAAAIGGLHKKVNEAGGEDVVLCGLSLGAMVALGYTIAHSERVAALVVSGAQVRPNPAIMLIEQALVRVMPPGLMGLPPELSKRKVREILNVVSRIDLRGSLDEIQVPTLAVCGERDRANLKAAKAIAEGVRNAKLEIIEDGGHELNTEKPVEFGNVLAGFLSALDLD